MFKSIISFTGDFLLSLILLGIITTSTVAVIALNPVGLQTKDASSVLGVKVDRDYLSFEEEVSSNPFFKIEHEKGAGKIYEKITFGPVTAGNFTRKVLTINNTTSEDRKFKITVNAKSDNFTTNIDALINKSKFSLINFRSEKTNSLTGTIKANSSSAFELTFTQGEDLKTTSVIEIFGEEVQ